MYPGINVIQDSKHHQWYNFEIYERVIKATDYIFSCIILAMTTTTVTEKMVYPGIMLFGIISLRFVRVNNFSYLLLKT